MLHLVKVGRALLTYIEKNLLKKVAQMVEMGMVEGITEAIGQIEAILAEAA